MELYKLEFQYSIETDSFNSFSYSFTSVSKDDSNEDIIMTATSSLQSLDKIILNTYKEQDLIKRKTGNITSRYTTFGHNYSVKNRESFTEINTSLVELKYFLNTDKGTITDIILKLNSLTSKYSKHLELYDSIISIEDLEISRSAQIEIDRVGFLRDKGFREENILSLPDDKSQE